MMNPSDKLRQAIIHKACGEVCSTTQQITDKWDELNEADDGFQDTIEEFRSGERATGLERDYSRHYEAKAVAAKMLDGSWVGWTYWFGGGKHGKPSSVPWIEDAYAVTATEVTRVVLEFTKV